jgi:hypothetical protein
MNVMIEKKQQRTKVKTCVSLSAQPEKIKKENDLCSDGNKVAKAPNKLW